MPSQFVVNGLFAFGTLFLFFHTLLTLERFAHWPRGKRIGASAIFSVSIVLIVFIVRMSHAT